MSTANSKPRVFLVDDEQVFRDFIVDILADRFDVSAFRTEEELSRRWNATDRRRSA